MACHRYNTKLTNQLTTKEWKNGQVLQIDKIANARWNGSTELVIGQIPIKSLFQVNIIQDNTHFKSLIFFCFRRQINNAKGQQ